MLAIQLFDRPPELGGKLLADWTGRAQLQCDTNDHGFLSATVVVKLGVREAFSWYERVTGWLLISHLTSTIWEGVAEDFDIGPDGTLTVTAYGCYTALADIPYTALWSSTRYSEWQQVETNLLATRIPDRYSIDTNNRLFMAPNGGDAQSTSAIGSLYLAIPHGSSRPITAIQFTYTFTAPAAWTVSLSRFDVSFNFLSVVWSLNGNGATQTNTMNYSSLSGSDMLMFNCYRNQAAATLNAAIAAGNRTITPSAMTGIKVGAKLSVSGVDPEDVDVTAVTATTFTAVFKFAHLATDTCVPVFEGETGDISFEVTGLRVKTTNSATVYADEIVKDVVATIAGVNPTMLNANTSLIQSPTIDLYNETFADQPGDGVVDHVLGYGDSSGRMWECAVWEQRIVQFQPRGSRGRTWYFDSTPSVQRRLERLWNSLYASYTDEMGIQRRTAINTNATSVARFGGRTRRTMISVDTTSPTQATTSRDVALNDSLSVGSVGDIPIDAVYDAVGNWYPVWMVRSGDTLIARNLPVGVSVVVDATRSFRVAATTYDASAEPALSVSAEMRSPRFAAYEVRRLNTR